jgi:DNA processing protein
MIQVPSAEPDRMARALLTHLPAPSRPWLSRLLTVMDPSEVLACTRSAAVPAAAAQALGEMPPERLLEHWRVLLDRLPSDGGITDAERAGIRLICPGDSEWPPGLDDLEDRPYALWACGEAGLRECCARSVAVIGARAATAYGTHVATSITTGLADSGLTIISGAAYGIDVAAHAAALFTETLNVAVLPCGPDISYPREHEDVLRRIAARGVIVSEYPPGRRPDRDAFLARNRIIAALAAGIVVVEAGLRSGTMNTVRHADLLGRPVMAVPGPVTSQASAGCHHLIAECGVPLVTSAADILGHLVT